ncbi:MAG: transferase [Desulfobacterium sp.]|jgi:carbonic anhydrase/acetyltransferase-like protein (isoleucine patch superfamily)|nr:transferase [Desulfobacterium sp.]
MKAIVTLFERILQRVNINLRELGFDATPYINIIPIGQMIKFYGFYGITPHHPLNFKFKNSNLAGSYFLGRCQVNNAILYKSDIRGDELKKRGDIFQYNDYKIPVVDNEEIQVEDSLLIKTLVHNFSHDPESLERFFIKDTISMNHSNIHGSPCEGCFIGVFATADLTTMHDCVIGNFAYIQAEEISHLNIPHGTIWVRNPGKFNFYYQHPQEKLNEYVYFSAGSPPQGKLIDFVADRKEAFQRVFDVVNIEQLIPVPSSASLDRYSVTRGQTTIGENVLVAQRAYLQNASLGKGANVQENCFVINSNLEGNDVAAHGAKIIEADLGSMVFVGFNSFLRGRPDNRLTIGENCIVMPHTIIDVNGAVNIPPGYLVWGLIQSEEDLETHSISIEEFTKVETRLAMGNMFFEGNGAAFVEAFQDRIRHILEANGAFFNGAEKKGHAQKNQYISFNTIQPYPEGNKKGLFPTIVIKP